MAKVDYKRIWHSLKERKIRSFTLLHENAKVKKDKYYMIELNKLSSELCEMDTLDGTQDFQNLLHDLKSFKEEDE